MRTLPREPWRGGQICGYQIECGRMHDVFCGELKKPGSPLCDEHDREMREEHGGKLPRFAPGNALGLAEYRRTTMPYMFELGWEPDEGSQPVTPTKEEVKAWEASGA